MSPALRAVRRRPGLPARPAVRRRLGLSACPASRAAPFAFAFAFAVALVLVLSLAACERDSYLPEGTAAILDKAEVGEEGTKSLAVQYSVRNSGRSAIALSTVSFGFGTDARRYYFSDTQALSLPPGGIVYLSARLAYYAATESADLSSVEILGAFFE